MGNSTSSKSVPDNIKLTNKKNHHQQDSNDFQYTKYLNAKQAPYLSPKYFIDFSSIKSLNQQRGKAHKSYSHLIYLSLSTIIKDNAQARIIKCIRSLKTCHTIRIKIDVYDQFEELTNIWWSLKNLKQIKAIEIVNVTNKSISLPPKAFSKFQYLQGINKLYLDMPIKYSGGNIINSHKYFCGHIRWFTKLEILDTEAKNAPVQSENCSFDKNTASLTPITTYYIQKASALRSLNLHLTQIFQLILIKNSIISLLNVENIGMTFVVEDLLDHKDQLALLFETLSLQDNIKKVRYNFSQQSEISGEDLPLWSQMIPSHLKFLDVDFGNTKINEAFVMDLLKYVDERSSLQDLKLTLNNCPSLLFLDEVLDNLKVSKLKDLKILDIDFSDLKIDEILLKTLGKFIAKLKKLQDLKINLQTTASNSLTEQGTHNLMSPLKSLTNLTSFSIKFKKLYEDSYTSGIGFEKLASHWSQMENLHISFDTEYLDIHLLDIGKGLKKLINLKQLEFDFLLSANIADEALDSVSEAIKNSTVNLRKVHMRLGYAYHLTDFALYQFAKASSKLKNLEDFCLEIKFLELITDDGIKGLSKRIGKMKKLIRLTIDTSHKDLSNNSLVYLGNCLKKLSQLKFVKICVKQSELIDKEGIEVFIEYLLKWENRNIREIKIQFSNGRYIQRLSEEQLTKIRNRKGLEVFSIDY